MSTGRSPEMPRCLELRLAALILVLAGLFGMHGLDGHDPVAMGSVHQAAIAGMPLSPTAAGRVMTHRSQPRVEVVSAVGGMDIGMAAMCVAILAGALMTLLRFLLGSRRPLLRVLTRHGQAVWGHPGRDPDPPSLIALSIQRC